MMAKFKAIALAFFVSSATISMAAPYNGTINLMTYNIGCLPTLGGMQVNGDFLRPNLERATEISQVVNAWNQGGTVFSSQGLQAPNVVGFQEAFDKKVRALLVQKLSAYYPYNTGNAGEKILNAGSGLLLFSQYPILEVEFHPYANEMVGDETLANKGFITAKMKYNNEYFFTVIVTHLEAGGGIDKDKQSLEGTTSIRRGEQMGRIYAQIQTKASVAPKGSESLKYLKTFVIGDLNTTLDTESEQKSISSGSSRTNGYKKGQIKYPGQYWLFSILKNSVPTNFFEVRVMNGEHEGKVVDPVLLQEAIQQNKFTGSIYPETELKKNKNEQIQLTRQTSGNRIIDGMYDSVDGVEGDWQSQVISMSEASTYKYAMSDHYPLIGQFRVKT
jgi:endonuclease/exonuclease/phosphatase family metal-dependent hydrolase